MNCNKSIDLDDTEKIKEVFLRFCFCNLVFKLSTVL